MLGDHALLEIVLVDCGTTISAFVRSFVRFVDLLSVAQCKLMLFHNLELNQLCINVGTDQKL